MHKIMTFILILVLVGCGVEPRKRSVEPTKLEKLKVKTELYEKLFKEQQDESGFIYTDACDSLIFTGISNPEANLTAAEVAPGRWLRRPTSYPECYATGKSRSEISRDGLLGVIYWSVENKRTDVLLRLWKYGEDHNWIMAEGGWQHAVFAPAHIALLAQAIYYTSDGKNDYYIRHSRYPMFGEGEGYQAHLQILHLLIQEKVYGTILDIDAKSVKSLADANPHNPAIAYAAGRGDLAADILLSTFPEGRLPTSSDWCGGWYNEQAPDGNGLKSCPEENKTHSGGDFLFVARQLLK
jgi:hypothetical protein